MLYSVGGLSFLSRSDGLCDRWVSSYGEMGWLEGGVRTPDGFDGWLSLLVWGSLIKRGHVFE
jgi:hypothetical protein